MADQFEVGSYARVVDPWGGVQIGRVLGTLNDGEVHVAWVSAGGNLESICSLPSRLVAVTVPEMPASASPSPEPEVVPEAKVEEPAAATDEAKVEEQAKADLVPEVAAKPVPAKYPTQTKPAPRWR